MLLGGMSHPNAEIPETNISQIRHLGYRSDS
jgi:hypothetical protein